MASRSGRTSFSKVRSYFHFLENNTWECSLCQNKFNGRNSSNLKQHLRIRHPEEYQKYTELNPASESYQNRINRAVMECKRATEQSSNEETPEKQVTPKSQKKIKDFYSHVKENMWKCSVCLKIIRAVNICSFLNHLQTHPDTYKEFQRASKQLPESRFSQSPKAGVKEEPVTVSASSPLEEEEEVIEEDWTMDAIIDDMPNVVYVEELQQHAKPVIVHSPPQSPVRPRKRTTMRESTDPLALFFQTMYETVKEMPNAEIYEVKRQVFAVVSAAEEKLAKKQKR